MTFHRYLAALAVVVGLAFGFAIGFSPAAEASRNSSGTYSLPSGSTVTTGTTITSSWANTLTSDLASELTNSLDRQGRGAMTAPLQCSSGTAAAPGLTFSADQDTGLYRVSAGTVGMSADGTQVQRWVSGSTTITGSMSVSGSTTWGGGIVVTTTTGGGTGVTSTGGASGGTGVVANGGTGNSTGLLATGTGSGSGVNATGGGTSGYGGAFTGGAPNGPAIFATGDGTGAGISATGGDSSGAGGSFTGGASNGNGLVSQGTGTGDGIQATGGNSSGEGVKGTGGTDGAGGYFISGTAATGGTRKTAVLVEAGDIVFTSTANPSITTGISNSVTPKNVVKAWARISMSGPGSVTVDNGFNISSAAFGGTGADFVRIVFASAFTDTTFACTVSGGTTSGPYLWVAVPVSTTQVDVGAYTDASTRVAMDSTFTNVSFNVICMGAQ